MFAFIKYACYVIYTEVAFNWLCILILLPKNEDYNQTDHYVILSSYTFALSASDWWCWPFVALNSMLCKKNIALFETV